MDKLLVAIGAVLLGVLVVVCLALFSAFTISTLWAWFIVPLGVTKIGFAHAYGISLISTVLLGARGVYDNSGKAIGLGITINILALCLGWIAVGLM